MDQDTLDITGRDKRWGVLLAGGEGTRLQRLTRLISGDERPKQFCALIGEETLLEQTRIRAENSVGREHILVPLTLAHARYYQEERGIPPSQRIVQPVNRGTAPPIIHSLLSIAAKDCNAIVAILPCDHHYSDDRAFTGALETAFDMAAENSESVVLMGAPPRGPETEYGWIELGLPMRKADIGSGNGDIVSFQVRGFREKPSSRLARQLFDKHSLWNTFVMVGHVRAFLEMVDAARPGLLEKFREPGAVRLWTGDETHVEVSFYDRLDSVDFSRDILSLQPWRLTALRLDFVGWNDLGQPERVMDVLRSVGLKPGWMKEWQLQKRPPGLAQENLAAFHKGSESGATAAA